MNRAAAVAVAVAVLAGCGSRDTRPPSGPAEQYERAFACLSDLGLKGANANRGPWPRPLVMLGTHDVVGAQVFRSVAAARRDHSELVRYKERVDRDARNGGLPSFLAGVRMVGTRWVSARVAGPKAAAAARCLAL